MTAGLAMGIGCVWVATFAAAPDRPARPGEWGYRPADGETVAVNPPPFTWVHEPKTAAYEVQWSVRRDFGGSKSQQTRWCVYTHDRALAAGDYYWRYRVVKPDGKSGEWSSVRRFTVPKDAVVFPKPTLARLKESVPDAHPRLFVRPEELPRLRQWTQGEGRKLLEKLRRDADRLIAGRPTPEPTVRGTIRDPATRNHWWSNRTQTEKACKEAETLALAYLLTGQERYGTAARKWILHLASWDPDGPTNFQLNCEAAKPMLYRLPRAYDWAHAALSESDRAQVQAALRRRAFDAWKSGEIGEGNRHLSSPYNSHGNRIWHKLGECAIALLDDVPEAEMWLDYAVNKFYAAYPVWSDDDGGWHEGLSYWAGYMAKFATWAEVSQKALGVDCFTKPYFAHAADYALYTAPPGSPNMGFGDLSYNPPSRGWAFVRYFARRGRNPYWEWWAQQSQMPLDPGEPALALLWGALEPVEAKPPIDLPSSKVFRGTGVAVLNSTLLDAKENVQIRLKSSPFGRQSHGHDPHNSFTLNAFGQPLLVNCVFRDWHGSKFHTQYCWTTKAQNALLVDGEGQKQHSPDPLGKIADWSFDKDVDYVVGDASGAYGDRVRRYLRHVLFIKPDVVVIADEVEAARPATFQWMLHALAPFELSKEGQQARIERDKIGVTIDYVADRPLEFRQTTGFEPSPDKEYLSGIGRQGFPGQSHLEAGTAEKAPQAFVLTVLRPYRGLPPGSLAIKRSESAVAIAAPTTGAPVHVAIRRPGSSSGKIENYSFSSFAQVRRGEGEWKVGR